jgi:hypothetical protein
MSKRNDNPWKGLDSYKESDRLYGRDEEIELLFSRIEYNIQTVVYSRSGIGKSSIINAGIFPKARRAGMLPISIRLQHTTNKDYPTVPYMEQVRQAIENELQSSGGRIEELVPHKDGHEETLWEFLHRHRFWLSDEQKPAVPLLVFDQFEEIFTLEKDHHRVTDFFSQVADLLNGIMPDYLTEADHIEGTTSNGMLNRQALFRGLRGRQRATIQYLTEDAFHIVFTLREDYLSFLERNTSHIPSLKMNRYCLLPINEEQAATIIMEPRPGLVDLDVAKLIIEKVTGETDFELDGRPAIFVDSAILSLYLSRLYDILPEGEEKITTQLVNQFGDNIIQDFYLEVIDGVRKESVVYLEDNLLNNEGRRENISVYNATHVGGLTEQELTYLCEEKRLLRRFAYSGDMRLEYIHDILCPIIKDRRDIRQMMKVQEEERQKILANERHKRELLELKAKADRRRYRNYMIAGCVAAAAVFFLWLYNYYMNVMPCNYYYESFTQANGWPVGVGPRLSEEEALKLSVSYKLSKKGHSPGTPFNMIEVMSSDGKLLHNKMRTPLVKHSEVSDVKGKVFSAMLNSTKYYKFSAIENSTTARVDKMEAFDINGKVLYVITYFKALEDRENSDGDTGASYVWAVYTDMKGAPLQVRDNGADRFQVFYNEQGMEERYMFFDETGAPKQNDLDCFGYRMHYDKENRVDSVWTLDPFGEEESLEVRTYSPQVDTFTFYDLKGHRAVQKKLGYHQRVETKDEKGNITRKDYYGVDQKLVDNRLRPAITVIKYDKLNRVAGTNDYDNANQPYTQNRKYYAQREYTYIGNTTDVLSELDYRWNSKRRKMEQVKSYVARLFGSVTEETTIDLDKNYYRMKRVEHNEDMEPVSISYYGKNDKPMFDSIDYFHKHITEQRVLPNGQRVVVHRFYDVNGKLFSDPEHRKYAIDSCIYSPRNQLLSRVCYSSDTVVVQSQGYEYKDGIEVARFARGIHGHPIRCPKWERDGLSYYKMLSVRSITDALSYVKPVSEYGCTSWAYDGQDPFGKFESRDQTLTTYRMGSNWTKTAITIVYADHVPMNAHSVVYVHLTRYNFPADRLGLRDGDLLLSIGSWKYTSDPSSTAAQGQWDRIGKTPMSMTVGRYNPKDRSWKVLTFKVPTFRGDFGCEIYPVYYTDDEYKEYEKLLAL